MHVICIKKILNVVQPIINHPFGNGLTPPINMMMTGGWFPEMEVS
jgi:hypothetical protein